MSGLILLESILDKLKPNYPEGLSDDDLFEFYCADNILVNYDLDHSEIEAGIVDGPRDAGIDAVYVFINRRLLTDDFRFDNAKQPVDIELFVFQAKNQDTFKEGPVDKLSSSLPLLLNLNQQTAVLDELFKKQVVTTLHSFLNAMRELAGEFPKIAIRIFYCSKGNTANDVIKAKAATLQATLRDKFQNVSFSFLGAQQLYDRSSNQKRLVVELPTTGTPLSGNNSYVALCKLTDYVKFIADDTGGLITRIFEANVRAYQGEVEVNREIADSLEHPTAGLDFWWLNNGVTIVADQAGFMNNRLTIENPLVVNGLQTSNEIHNISPKLQPGEARMILVRVIVETDREKRDEIIRATNRQTAVTHSSFRATEAIHREIEDYLLTLGYFYGRRKNFYKREAKPADKIVSIDRLAQAILSVLLQEPHTARGRPTTAIKGDNDYKRIFSSDKTQHPLEMYGVVVELLDRVEGFFRRNSWRIDRVYRNNLKFHVLMVLAWALNGNSTLPARRITQLELFKLREAEISAVVQWVRQEFDFVGAEDRTAKDSAFTQRLRSNWSVAATRPALATTLTSAVGTDPAT
jgi:AIPR protein